MRLAAIVDKVRGERNTSECLLVASGTALDRNEGLRQMIADCCGVKVRVLREGEATSRGVAVLVAGILGADCTDEGDAEADVWGGVCEPREFEKGRWDAGRERQRRVTEAMARAEGW